MARHFVIMHPFQSGSHILTLHTISEQLVSRGHNVTTIRFVQNHKLYLKDLGPGHTDIVLYLNNSDGSMPSVTGGERGVFEMPMNLLWTSGLSPTSLFVMPSDPWIVVRSYCNTLLGNKELVSRLSKEKFDVAIVDLITNECGLALAHHLKLPTIGYWAFSFSNGEADYTTVATPPSHIPCFLSSLSHNMSFMERVYNFVLKVSSQLLMQYHTWVCDSVISSHFPNIPSTRNLLADLNGALINTNNILDYPRLQPETFINIGGIQISSKPRKLPIKLLSFIEGAEAGVILFAMGFLFNPGVAQERVDALLNAFSRLPQRVILKLNDPIAHTPANVLVLPFLPQQEILAHPKTILFVTHCGMHGVMEAIYHRVPMVGMPVFFDQGDVLVRMKEKGIAVGIDKFSSSDDIHSAIVRVRDDKR